MDAEAPHSASQSTTYQDDSIHAGNPQVTTYSDAAFHTTTEQTPGSSYAAPDEPDAAFMQTWLELQSALKVRWDGMGFGEVFMAYVELYMRYLFPITPLVDEKIMRAIATRLHPVLTDCEQHLACPQNAIQNQRTTFAAVAQADGVVDMANGTLTVERSLTLLTAVAATTAALVPSALLSESLYDAGVELLAGSRKLLRCFQDQDVDRPCAVSIITRYFHSQCTHAAGQLRLSWYILGEAIRVAQELRIYDEDSFGALSMREAHLRRSIYWQLSTGDKSAAILNGRPFAFNAANFDKPFLVRSLSEHQNCLVDDQPLRPNKDIIRYVNRGFNLIATLFEHAARMLATLRTLQRHKRDATMAACLPPFSDAASLIEDLSMFQQAVSDLPDWLQRPSAAGQICGTQTDREYTTGYAWTLHVNIMLTYHCLRLMLLNQAAEMGRPDLLGYLPDPRLLGIHKLEIAGQALHVLHSAPFEALQLNGESAVGVSRGDYGNGRSLIKWA